MIKMDIIAPINAPAPPPRNAPTPAPMTKIISTQKARPTAVAKDSKNAINKITITATIATAVQMMIFLFLFFSASISFWRFSSSVICGAAGLFSFGFFSSLGVSGFSGTLGRSCGERKMSGSTPCCRPLIAYQQRRAGLSMAARMRRSS